MYTYFLQFKGCLKIPIPPFFPLENSKTLLPIGGEMKYFIFQNYFLLTGELDTPRSYITNLIKLKPVR